MLTRRPAPAPPVVLLCLPSRQSSPRPGNRTSPPPRLRPGSWGRTGRDPRAGTFFPRKGPGRCGKELDALRGEYGPGRASSNSYASPCSCVGWTASRGAGAVVSCPGCTCRTVSASRGTGTGSSDPRVHSRPTPLPHRREAPGPRPATHTRPLWPSESRPHPRRVPTLTGHPICVTRRDLRDTDAVSGVTPRFPRTWRKRTRTPGRSPTVPGPVGSRRSEGTGSPTIRVPVPTRAPSPPVTPSPRPRDQDLYRYTTPVPEKTSGPYELGSKDGGTRGREVPVPKVTRTVLLPATTPGTPAHHLIGK